ncbi:HECT-domain-containing protein [Gigaspora margarita]|uniref:HECT-type E3 ubiquitin transferase n=1 Tax=Gigaspora margarita TaxID=4874 RepID=A0A8H3XFY4_GIGMA|nr:HECT-domain-containing protein [Gigaspora margarita]
MFNSFEGNFKTRPKINLGGQRAQEDKSTLIKKNKEQRRERDNERLRQKSALKIQAFYRGRNVAGNLRNKERALWDQNAEAIFRAVHTKWDVNAAASLVELVRSFLFFYRSSHDAQRELCLCQILWKKMFDVETIFVPFYYEDLRHTWFHQLKKLLLIFLKSVGSQSINRDRDIINYLKTLFLAVDVNKYKQLEEGGRKISLELLKYLVNHGLYRELRNQLTNLEIENKDENKQTIMIISFSLYPFQIIPISDPYYASAYESSLKDFITYIFTIPLLADRVETLELLSSQMPLYNIISTIASNDWNAEQGSILLSNLLAFTRLEVNKMNDSELLAYLTVLQRLFVRIPDNLLTDKTTSTNYDDDDDDGGNNDVIIPDHLESFDEPQIDPNILKWISVLIDDRHLESVLTFAKSENTTALLKISYFLATLMIRWPSEKSDLLSKMSYGKLSISENKLSINALWEAFKKTDLARLLSNSQPLSNSFITDTTFIEQWGMFYLFCELFSRILLPMDDYEFFDGSKNPLKLPEIIEMSTYLKNIAFILYWNSPQLKISNVIEGSCIKPIYIREVATRLLKQIHARDSRRRFTPERHWLMTSEFDMSTFAKIVVAEEQELENDKMNMDKRQLESVSPRLGVLHNIPFVIPFEERVKIFRQFVRNDRERHIHTIFEPRTRVTIRRSKIFDDGFTHLNAMGPRLKNPVAIQFIDEFGIQEAGIDGGGLFKEFLTSLTRIAFDAEYGLFLSTNEQLLYPNPHSYARNETQLHHYEFLGRILGKALYEGILVDAAFAGFFLSKWLGERSYLDDLPSVDPELYQGLVYLKNYKGDVESDLSLNFTVVDNEFGESRTIELITGGSDIPVTKHNRINYIYKMVNYRLNVQIGLQCQAFFRGLIDLIEPKWLKMFNQQELQILVGGAYIPINIADLQQNTVYSDYKDDDPVIINFWKVVSEFSEEQKQKLIKFVTSCSRPPLLGFKELNPKFSIRRAGTGARLPSSSTCVNLLKLPAYPDENTLRQKLSYAINADVGFDLS